MVQLEYNLLQVMVVVAIDCYKEQVNYNIHPTYEAFDTDAQDVERRGNVTKSARTKSFSKQTTFVLYICTYFCALGKFVFVRVCNFLL